MALHVSLYLDSSVGNYTDIRKDLGVKRSILIDEQKNLCIDVIELKEKNTPKFSPM